jgi:hypothetical protein
LYSRVCPHVIFSILLKGNSPPLHPVLGWRFSLHLTYNSPALTKQSRFAVRNRCHYTSARIWLLVQISFVWISAITLPVDVTKDFFSQFCAILIDKKNILPITDHASGTCVRLRWVRLFAHSNCKIVSKLCIA